MDKVSYNERPVIMICLKEQVQTKSKVQVEKRHKAITRTLIYSGLDLKKKPSPYETYFEGK